MTRCCLATALTCIVVSRAAAQVQTFPNNYTGFLQAAGAVQVIDFETLPDGTPSAGHTGTLITESFNYDLQGAHFSTPIAYPSIAGNTTDGFSLRAGYVGAPDRTWIIADMTLAVRGIGAFYGGGTTLYAYDASGSLLGSVFYGASGSGHFAGIVSLTTPIARVRIDRNTNIEDIQAFVYAPVPEPCTTALFALGAGWALRGRRGRR